jgi:hypothetical protein
MRHMNVHGEMLHVWGFNPECHSTCLLRLHFSANRFWQIWHSWGFSPVCRFIWSFNEHAWLYPFPDIQTLYRDMKGFIQVRLHLYALSVLKHFSQMQSYTITLSYTQESNDLSVICVGKVLNVITIR